MSACALPWCHYPARAGSFFCSNDATRFALSPEGMRATAVANWVVRPGLGEAGLALGAQVFRERLAAYVARVGAERVRHHTRRRRA